MKLQKKMYSFIEMEITIPERAFSFFFSKIIEANSLQKSVYG